MWIRWQDKCSEGLVEFFWFLFPTPQSFFIQFTFSSHIMTIFLPYTLLSALYDLIGVQLPLQCSQETYTAQVQCQLLKTHKNTSTGEKKLYLISWYKTFILTPHLLRQSPTPYQKVMNGTKNWIWNEDSQPVGKLCWIICTYSIHHNYLFEFPKHISLNLRSMKKNTVL